MNEHDEDEGTVLIRRIADRVMDTKLRYATHLECFKKAQTVIREELQPLVALGIAKIDEEEDYSSVRLPVGDTTFKLSMRRERHKPGPYEGYVQVGFVKVEHTGGTARIVYDGDGNLYLERGDEREPLDWVLLQFLAEIMGA